MVRALQVGDAGPIERRQFSGRAKAAQEAVLAFRIAGQVYDIPVNVGDTVAEGDVIATLDPGPYQAEVNRLTAELASATAIHENAAGQFERVAELVESGTYAQARGDQAKADRDSAKAAVESVRAALQRAQLDLDYTVITASYDGRIVATYAENFEEVRPQQEVARLLDMKSIEMVVDIPETLISLVPRVGSALVVFDAFPDTEIIATVKEVGAEASQTTRTYPVTLTMDQPDDVVILPGMAGQASARDVQLPEDAQGFAVPPEALVRSETDGTMAVWVVDPTSSAVALRPVVVGAVTETGATINSGLDVGEWVVIAGANSLEEGQKVRLPSDDS